MNTNECRIFIIVKITCFIAAKRSRSSSVRLISSNFVRTWWFTCSNSSAILPDCVCYKKIMERKTFSIWLSFIIWMDFIKEQKKKKQQRKKAVLQKLQIDIVETCINTRISTSVALSNFLRNSGSVSKTLTTSFKYRVYSRSS